jgi:hypothetical protein
MCDIIRISMKLFLLITFIALTLTNLQAGTIQVTFNTNPATLNVIVDGVETPTPGTLVWDAGSTHSLNLDFIQPLGLESCGFSHWSDGGGQDMQAHSVSPAVSTQYTANFLCKYQLVTSSSPSVGGAVAVSPNQKYFWPGRPAQLTATPAANCQFLQFTDNGSPISTSPVTDIVFSTNQIVVAEFTCATMPTGSVPAKAADNFVDSIGTNLHMHYNGTLYYDNFPLVETRLKQLGIRHIRDGLIDSTAWPTYYARLDQLGVDGIKGIYISDIGESAALLASYPVLMPHSFEGYEGPNEYDTRGDANWVATLTNFQQFLYGTVKGNPATEQYQVIAPSLTSQQSFDSLGNISATFDSGNLHNYPGGHTPETGGWGSDGYGSVTWNLNIANTYAGGKPVMTTETGYFTSPELQQGVPVIQEGRYVPRVFLNQFNFGIPKTYLYELADEGASQGTAQYNYGMLYSDGSPKPAFTALSNLIQLLSDPGPAFPLGGLTYTLSGSTANVAQTLLEKRDGTLYLILWLELPGYDINAMQTITVPAQNVNVNFNQAATSPTIYTFDDTGGIAAAPASVVNGTIGISVTDRVSVLVIPPPAT